MRILLALAVFLAVFHGGKADDSTPAHPMWPTEFVQLIAGEEFQMKLNFSFGNQELFIDVNSYGYREQLYLSCRGATRMHIYYGNPQIGTICYNVSLESVDEEILCPITKYPFLAFVDADLKFDGEQEFEGQQIYTWIGGWNGLYCNPCSVYWETKDDDPLKRIPIAADYHVYYALGVLVADPAGYYQYFEEFSQPERVVQPDGPCHYRHPSFGSPPKSSVEKEAPLPKEEESILIRTLNDIMPRIKQHGEIAKTGRDPGPIFTFPNEYY